MRGGQGVRGCAVLSAVPRAVAFLAHGADAHVCGHSSEEAVLERGGPRPGT